MPEKSLSEISRPLRDMYEKGKMALQRNNLDYALLNFEQVLQKEPGFFDCREAMRAAQFKKSGVSTGFFKKMFGAASSSPQMAKGKMALQKDPLEALNIAEQILMGDPNNAMAHRLLADAAIGAGMPRTAILSMEIISRANPKDKDLRLSLADLYVKNNQIPKAEAIYQDLLSINPGDAEVSQAYKNLSARRTLDEGGYQSLADGKGSYRDVLKNKEEAISLEQEKRQIKTEDVAERLIGEYETRLQQEPKNLKIIRSLAELYAQKKDFDRALEYFEMIKQSDLGADSSLDKLIGDTRLKKIDWQMEQLDVSAPDYAEQAAAIQAQRRAFELDECRQRAERYPTDLQIRFDLGVLYFQCGKISDAIGEFQKAQNNPQRRIQSLGYLGQCFAHRGMNDSAVRMLQNAIKEKPNFDDEKKDLIYNLGCILEKMGKREEALEQLKQIYENDIGYKDIAAKVDAYYAGQ